MSDQAVHIVQGSSELSVPTRHPPAHAAAHPQLPLNGGLRCINTVEQNAANVFANDEKRHLCLALKLPAGEPNRVVVRRREEKREPVSAKSRKSWAVCGWHNQGLC